MEREKEKGWGKGEEMVRKEKKGKREKISHLRAYAPGQIG
jgi:hypothetical protein